MKKTLLLLSIIALLFSCVDKKEADNQSPVDDSKENNIATAKELSDSIFFLINLNMEMKLSDEEFKPKADRIQASLDSVLSLIDEAGKEEVNEYRATLLEGLIKKEMDRKN